MKTTLYHGIFSAALFILFGVGISAPRAAYPQSPDDPIVQIKAGNDFNCARTRSGLVKCWGNNAFGQLGQEHRNAIGTTLESLGANLKPVNLGTSRTAVDITLGSTHACALLDDGSAKCWGRNSFGQLGLGTNINLGDDPNEMGDALPRIQFARNQRLVKIAAGGNTTCALFESRQALCWGSNAQGMAGQETSISTVGTDPMNIPALLPPIELGTNLRVVDLFVSTSHICALLEDRSAKCWGNNSLGQLGLGDTKNRGRETGTMGNALPYPSLGTDEKIQTMTLGELHTCASFENGRMKCWGFNDFGQLGVGDSLIRGSTPETLGMALPWVMPSSGLSLLQIEANTYSTCALLQNRAIKCWGSNAFGQLGQGDQLNRGDSPQNSGDALPFIRLGRNARPVQVAMGNAHVCTLLQDGSVKCWGRNSSGQLGQGHNRAIGTNPNDMGDALQKAQL